MPNLKIAYSPKVEQYFSTNRELVEIDKTDFTDVAAIVLTAGDAVNTLNVFRQQTLVFQYLLFKLKKNKLIRNSMMPFIIFKI